MRWTDNDTLSPYQRTRLGCIAARCPGVQEGCTLTPGTCPHYGRQEDANEVYCGPRSCLAPTPQAKQMGAVLRLLNVLAWALMLWGGAVLAWQGLTWLMEMWR